MMDHGCLEIRDVLIRPRGGIEPLAEAHLDRLRIHCRATLREWANRRPRVESVEVFGAILRTHRDATGAWNLRSLWPGDRDPRVLPKFHLQAGTMEVVDQSRSPQSLWRIEGIEILARKSTARNAGGGEVTVAVSLGQQCWRQCLVTGTWRDAQEWSFHGQVQGMRLNPESVGIMPADAWRYLSHLGPFQADADLTFVFQRRTEWPAPQFTLQGKCHNGRMDDPRLTYPLTDVTADFSVDAAGIHATRSSARYGSAVIDCVGDFPFPLALGDLRARGSVSHLSVDEKLVAYLPPAVRGQWERLRPIGVFDAQFELDRKEGEWRPQIELQGRNISCLWERFPYPLEGADCTVSIQPRTLNFGLICPDERKPLEVRGEMRFPEGWAPLIAGLRREPNMTPPHPPAPLPWTGWFEVRNRQPQTLDPWLIRAMAANTREVVEAFHPQGLFLFAGRWERDVPQGPLRRRWSIDIQKGRIQHDAFPYPLQELRGHLEAQDDVWRFRHLAASNDSGQFTGEGELESSAEGRILTLRITGVDVPLEDELRAAFKPGPQVIWRHLQPGGSLDHLQLVYRRNQTTGQESISATARKGSARGDMDHGGLRILPRSFPYELQDVSGLVTYQNGRFTIQQMRARHGNVVISLEGDASLSDGRIWELGLGSVVFDQLQPDAEFLSALPVKLREILVRHQLSGSICARGDMFLRGQLGSDGPDLVTWDMSIDLEDSRLRCGVPINHVCGEIRLTGKAEGDRFACRGELAIDSLELRNFHLANVRGPLAGDEKRLLLGTLSQPDAGLQAHPGAPPPRTITATVCGGRWTLDGQCLNDEAGTFDLTSHVEHADLEAFTRDFLPTGTPVRGDLSSVCRIRGNTLGMHSLGGEGSVQLRGTDLYKLPVVLDLLRSLRKGKEAQGAFDSSDIDFRVQGEHVYLDKVDLTGDTLTLKGAGELNARREVDLNFYTVLGREDAYLPAVRPLLGLASQRFLLIKVGGTLDHPSLSREILPGLNETMQRLFPEATPPSASPQDVIPAGWNSAPRG